MDQEIAELKREVESLKAVTIDTNHIVHGMRRGQRWRSFASILWWVLIIGASVGSFYFIQPYLQKVLDAYTGMQQNAKTAEGWQQQAQDFYNKYLAPPATTP